MIKYVIAAVLSLCVVGVSGCRSTPFIINEGPIFARTIVSSGTTFALGQKQATVAEAEQIKTYVQEALVFIQDGSAPVSALDQLAEYLNTRISNATLRMVIQQGIEMLKKSVVLPPPGDKIPSSVRTWVYAIMGGVVDGCNAYIAGHVSTSAPRAVNPVISFK